MRQCFAQSRANCAIVRRRIPRTIPRTIIGAAAVLGIHQETVSAYGSGKSPVPRVVALACLAVDAGLHKSSPLRDHAEVDGQIKQPPFDPPAKV